MTPIDKFQRIRDYIDSQNIVDHIVSFLSEDELLEFCNYLEDEYEIEYEDEYSGEFEE